MFSDIGTTAYDLLLMVMRPFRLIMEGAGLHPADMQVWALMVGLFLLAGIVPHTIGDLILMRRNARATGQVIALRDDNDGGFFPTIGFKDVAGERWQFESGLTTNSRTGEVGAAVVVLYDPRHPMRAREAGRPLARLLITLFWYAFVGVVLYYAFFGFPDGTA